MSHHIGTGLIAGELAHHQGVGTTGSLGSGIIASELAQHANTGTIGSLGTGVATGLVASKLGGHHQGTGYTSGAPLGTGIGQTAFVDKGFNSGLNQEYTSGFNPSLNSGFNQGINSGYNPSLNSGFDQGINSGYNPSLNSGFNQGLTSGYNQEYTSGFNQGLTSGYNPSLNQGLTSGLGTGPIIGAETGHHSKNPLHHHHATNIGTGPTGTGYGSHETHHGLGVGGIGEGLQTFSSNVSTNPNYLNEVGFNGTGIASNLSNAVPTTTGGFAGSHLHNNNLSTGLNSGLNPGFNSGLNTTGNSLLNNGTGYVEQPHLSTMDKIKAKLHM